MRRVMVGIRGHAGHRTGGEQRPKRGRRVIGLLAGIAALAALGGSTSSAAASPAPLDPTTGQTALLGTISSIPLRTIDRALLKYPVPYVISARAGGAPVTIVNNLAGTPQKIDLDQDRNTGKAGKDVEVVVRQSLTPTPNITLTVTRLGTAPYATGVEILAVFPFDAFTSETLAAPTHLFIGFESPGGVPAIEALNLRPVGLAGTTHDYRLSHSAVGFPTAPGDLRLSAGHISGTSSTGVVDVSGFSMHTTPAPASQVMTVSVAESSVGDPVASSFGLDWSASATTDATLFYIEDEDGAGADPEFETSLTIDNLPGKATIEQHVDEEQGTFALHLDGSAAIAGAELTRTRSDGTEFTATATDIPTLAHIDGALSGELAVDVSAPTMNVDLSIDHDGAFPDTEALLGHDLGYLQLSVDDLPDLGAGFQNEATGLAFTLDADGNVPRLDLVVGDDDTLDLPPAWMGDPQHVFSIIDDGSDATAAVRVTNASEVALAFDTVTISESLSFTTSVPALLQTHLDLDPTSTLVGGTDVDMTCDLDAIPAGTATFATDFAGSFSYVSDPPTALSSLSCAGQIGDLHAELEVEDLPASFSFEFDPGSHFTVDLGQPAASVSSILSIASTPEPPTIGLLAIRLDTPGGEGIPGSSELFDVPLDDARVRADGIPSMTASWADSSDGSDIELTTAEPGTTIDALQVAVTTDHGLDAFTEPAEDAAHTVDLDSDDADGTQALAGTFLDAEALSLNHDAATGIADVAAETVGTRPMNFSLDSPFGGEAEDVDSTCTVDPVPAGGFDLKTDLSTEFHTKSDEPVDGLSCTGQVGGVDVVADLTDLAPIVDIALDPAAGLKISGSDNLAGDVLGAIDVSLSAPAGIPGSDDLFGEVLKSATFALDGVPELTGGFATGADGSSFDILTDSAADVLDSVTVAVSTGDLGSLPPIPTSPDVLLDTITDGVSTLAGTLFGISNAQITFDPTTGVLNVLIDSTTAQKLTLNVNTTYPPGATPLDLSCEIDQTPAGRFTMSTNFNTFFSTTTEPPTGIELIACNGRNGGVKFLNEFTDLPPEMTYQLNPSGSISMLLNDGTEPATNDDALGSMVMHVTSEAGGILGTAGGLFGPQPLSELFAASTDVESFEGSFVGGSSPSFEFDTLADDATVSTIQVGFATAFDPDAPLINSTPSAGHELRFLAPRDPDFGFSDKLLLARLYDIDQLAMSASDGSTAFELSSSASHPMDIELIAAQPGPGVDTLADTADDTDTDVAATITIVEVPATLSFETDMKTSLDVHASESIESISVTASSEQLEPEPWGAPTEISLSLTNLPTDLVVDFDLENEDVKEVAFTGSGPTGGVVADITSATGINGEIHPLLIKRWQHVEVNEIPANVSLTMQDVQSATEAFLDVSLVVDDGNGVEEPEDAIGSVSIIQSIALPAESGAFLDAFTDVSGALTADCLIPRSALEAEVDDRAFGATAVNSVEDRLDNLHCNEFSMNPDQDHIVTRSDKVDVEVDDGEGGTKTVKLTRTAYQDLVVHDIGSIDFLQERALTPAEGEEPDTSPKPVTLSLRSPSAETHPLFYGDHLIPAEGPESLTMARLADLPDTIDFDFEPGETLAYGASGSAGTIQIYSGPRVGAAQTDTATRMTLLNSPAEVDIEFGNLMELNTDNIQIPQGSFTASDQFELQLLHQDGVMRIAMAAEMEDLEFEYTNIFGYPEGDICEPFQGFNTCLHLLQLGLVLDVTGSSSGEGVSGFFNLGLLSTDAESLRDADDVVVVEPNGNEYLPLAHVLLRDLESIDASVELAIDLIPDLAEGHFYVLLPPLEVDFAVGPQFSNDGDIRVDLFDHGFEGCIDFFPDDDDNPPDCVDFAPSYINNAPWHLWLPGVGGAKFDPFE